MTSHDDIDLAHVRRVASNASACVGLLGAAGSQILLLLSVLDIVGSLSPEVAPEYVEAAKRSRANLEFAWAGMFDVVGVPRRPLPRLPTTKH